MCKIDEENFLVRNFASKRSSAKPYWGYFVKKPVFFRIVRKCWKKSSKKIFPQKFSPDTEGSFENPAKNDSKYFFKNPLVLQKNLCSRRSQF